MKRWWYVLFPVLWAVCPVLFLYIHNFSELSSSVLVVPLLITVGLALATWGIFLWRYRDAAEASLGASFVVLMIMLYGHVFNLITFGAETTAIGTDDAYFVIWLLLLIGGVIVLRKFSRQTVMLAEILNAAGVVLAIFLVLQIHLHRTPARAPLRSRERARP